MNRLNLNDGVRLEACVQAHTRILMDITGTIAMSNLSQKCDAGGIPKQG